MPPRNFRRSYSADAMDMILKLRFGEDLRRDEPAVSIYRVAKKLVRIHFYKYITPSPYHLYFKLPQIKDSSCQNFGLNFGLFSLFS